MVGQRGWRRWAVIVAFLAPGFVPLLLFTIGPMVASAGLSLLRWDLLRPPRFIGLDNYARLAGDADFRAAVGHTIQFVAGYLPLVLVGGLVIALALNQRLRGLALFRTVYFMPLVTSWVVVALMWRWLLDPRAGIAVTAAPAPRHAELRGREEDTLLPALNHTVLVDDPRA